MATERIQRRIERLLDQIEEAMEGLDWESVRDRSQAVLRLDPENADALAYLAAADREPVISAPSVAPSESRVAEVPAEPRSFSEGRYQVKRFLGEGGKKKVYLAHDTTLDREVAFALIKTDGLDETSRTRIQREAQAMGRLGSHSHIVTVFDLGEEQGQPYMVTELMGGGDVEGVIEDAEDHRLPLEQAIKIAQETCRGMEFAHSRGIVHRDLKPGNVWLTEDGIAKIGDFGLAVALDRSRLTTEGMMVGTVSYMPPEQAMGGEVTPRSDLYSLGAMLYEMVTGRPPFLGDDSVAIIGQHINTPPVAPTWHNGQCPRVLDALILRLLAKDPSERPESATDVLSALDAIDLADADVGAHGHAPLQDNDLHALDSLAGGVFVGRQREMGELKGCLEDALSGRGRLVTLVGEPGIGKSRTAQELATYAGLRHAQVLWGRCYEGEGAPPYWPWVQAIRTYVRDRNSEELRSEMGAGAANIAEIVSAVSEKLPGLAVSPDLEPEQARFRLFDSITSFLKNASNHQPLVLVLDDLHWADHPSLLLLEFLARELSGSRLLVIGTYRDMELSRSHPLSLTLGELNRERLFQRVLLRGLVQEDVGRFIDLVSAIAPPQGMVEAVHRQTEGNPLFVTEVVRLLVQEGDLAKEKGGGRDSWNVRIPEGVREVIGRRLDRLSKRCNESLTIASVIGREFTLEFLRLLMEDVSEDRLLEILEEALAARVIEELPSSVGRYQFTHALIQDALIAELSTTRKVRLHARIAEELEGFFKDSIDAHATELANHFNEAQTVLGTDRLVRYSLMAGERALASHAYEEALTYFERGLVAIAAPLDGAAPARDADEASLLFGFGRAAAVTSERSRLQDVSDILGRAFEYYEEMGDTLRAVAVAEYKLPSTTVGRSVASRYLLRALKLAAPQSLSAGRLLSIYGAEIGRLDNDYQGAIDVFAQALAIAENEHDSALELNTLLASANVNLFHLRTHQAVEKAEQAIRLASQIGDQQAAWGAHLDAHRCLVMTGDSSGALQHASIGLELSEKQRARYRLAQALEMNAQIQRLRGDWPATRDFVERGLTVAPQDETVRRNRMFLEYESGDFVSGDVNMKWTIEGLTSASTRHGAGTAQPALIIACVARITGILNHSDTSILVAQELVSSRYANPLFVTSARAALGIWSVLHNDTTASAENYNALVQVKGSLIPFFFSGDRLLGLLSHTMRNLDQAAAHFEDALAFCRKAGYRPELAWTCCDYADALRDRDGKGDREIAVQLLEESLVISSEMGMRPLMERVLSRREILKA